MACELALLEQVLNVLPNVLAWLAMQMLASFFSWSPWLGFLTECALMQLLFVVTFFFFANSRSLFYALVYLFILFIWFGLALAYLGLELFTGFLWVVELSVFFILLMFLFFFNFGAELRGSSCTRYKVLSLSSFFFLFLFDDYSRVHSSLNVFYTYDDFYSAIGSDSMSDVHSLFLSYYFFNSFLLFVFGFFVFLTSVVCVLLLRSSRSVYSESIGSFLSIYNFFSDLLNFELLRKQSLGNQVLRRCNSRVISKDKKEWYKKKAN